MQKYRLQEHLLELKSRLLWVVSVFTIGFLICYAFAQEIYIFLVSPLADILSNQGRKVIFTGLTEAFLTYLKIAAFTSFIMTIPVVAWHIYRFIAPGLYKDEQYIAKIILICCPILFWLGSVFVFYLVMPKAFEFFLSFELQKSSLPLMLETRISEYLSLVIHLVIAFGLAAELPVVFVILHLIGFVSTEFLVQKRRLAIVINFIIAGIITPPDIFSQIALALPMTLLYEISIKICRALDKRSTHVRH
jgi:sec-independent protein translocase protein TatC